MTSPVRYNKDMGEFEYRCDSCKKENKGAYWFPLTLDFWNPANGMKQCRVCQHKTKARYMSKRRTDPVFRQRSVDAVREIRKVKGHIYEEKRKRAA